jgi:hypothetical protein
MEHLAIVAAGTVGITQVFKMLGVPSKFLPVIATVLGGALAFALTPEAGVKGVVLGVIEGLSATGLVNFGKTWGSAKLKKPAAEVKEVPKEEANQ